MPPARKDVVHFVQEQPFKERRACVGCRAIKSRCMMQPGWARCSRCARLDLDCAFLDHHRGVRQRECQQSQVPSQDDQTKSNPFSIQSMLSTNTGRESTLLSSTAFATIQETPKFDPCSSAALVVPIEDIVAAGVVTKTEASQMITFFYSRLNPIVALLDSQIYSQDNLLRRVEFRLLLASICTISAKFCQVEKYVPCLRFLEPVLCKIAAGDSVSQLETVLSLSLLAMWKHPSDGTSWRKLRLAVTLGFELGLQHSFKQGNQYRSAIQAQRSFLQLACFEDGYNDQCRMPPSIDASFLPEPWKWIESLGDAVQDIDIRLAASRENALVKQQLVRQLNELKDSSKATCMQRVRLINMAIEAEHSNSRVWKDPVAYGLPCQHSGRPCLLFHTSNTLFNYHRALHSVYCSPSLADYVELRQATFLKCCQLAIELFELFNGPYGGHEYYRFVHDIVILNLAVAAVWISDNWQGMPASLSSQAIAAVCAAADVTQPSLERRAEQGSFLAQFLAFCTTKFSAFRSNEAESQPQQDMVSRDDQDWTFTTPNHDPAIVQSDTTRYLQELLTTPCIQHSDAVDTNSILSFFQEPGVRQESDATMTSYRF